jgi:hypothetical protein
VSALEQRLAEAFRAAAGDVVEHPDLFARVRRSIEEDRQRRRWRVTVAVRAAVLVLVLAAVSLVGSDYEDGRVVMPWWLLEVLTNAVLVVIAVVLGPFIKRFGRSYAADVFRANPRTGKSYIVLVDVAYYLIFLAFILLTANFEPRSDWADTVNAAQVKSEVTRVAGILLLLGLLHSANVVLLPFMGRLLSLNSKLDAGMPGDGKGKATELRQGEWVLRIEPASPGRRTETFFGEPGPEEPGGA